MASKISEQSINQYPLGAALQYLRGAKQNLDESLKSNDFNLVWIRRKELSLILNRIGKIHNQELINNSLVTFHLIHNLNMEVDIATAMLRDASSYLSAALSPI
ncbi:hypothetical protein [Legionella sp.]|uniref:hypothetical protein n=1 Tax=Legionella sp. TaxID=459 RepID=UPI003CC53A2E